MTEEEPGESTHTGLGDRFVVVLFETQDLVNIAGTVRAMLNMGARRLRLVRPVEYDVWRISGIAHGSERLLERVELFDSLEDALADTVHVVGTTARRRTASFVWQHPREAAPELHALAEHGPVALLFGREDKGLSNEQLDLCDLLLNIPTSPEHPSLNLAQAALLVLYELSLASPADPPELPRGRRAAAPATHAQMQELFEDAHRALEAIEFYKKRQPEAIMRSVRAAARRAGLDAREARLLRAMAIEVRKVVERLEHDA